jgi:hypothetical protein
MTEYFSPRLLSHFRTPEVARSERAAVYHSIRRNKSYLPAKTGLRFSMNARLPSA